MSIASGLPNLTKSENDFPKCGWITPNNSYIACTPEQYFQGAASESPVFPTAYTPVYSNLGFATIGYALSNIAGKPFDTLFNENLVQSLGLKGTYPTVPKTIPDNAVIPGNPDVDGWSANLGVFGTLVLL
jgi:CubicO group peptidase (beta-lactamase class C family)